MSIQNLSNDDSAVSPVIGVILMVAITVILAAVIASFVLGMGPNTAQTPTASFSSEYSDDDPSANDGGTVTITMDSGETLTAGDFSVNGDGLDSPGNLEDADDSTPSLSESSEVTAGTSFDIVVTQDDYVINLVYESSDTTSTMQTFEG